MTRIPTDPWPWAAIVLAACCAAPAAAADGLPPAPDYLGEIRRDADGRLKAVPPSAEKTAPNLGWSVISPADEAEPRIIRVGRGEAVTTVSEAARLARDGDIVEITPGEYRRQPAVWTQHKLTIRGGGRALMIADGASAEGKAIWVVRGGQVRIEGIEFRGARAGGGDGAGILFEKGHLSIERCGFFDNEIGLIAAGSPEMTLIIRDSRFGGAPRHAGPLRHLLDVGRIGRLTLRGSRFQEGFRGQLVRSRARESHVLYNLIRDGPRGQASYELEFPEGGLAYVVGNVIGQSGKTENPAMVAYGAEGGTWPENALYFAHNTLINENSTATFLQSWPDRLPGDAEVWAINNLTIGQGRLDPPAHGRFEGNRSMERSALVDYGGLPLKLPPLSPLRGVSRPAGRVRDIDLTPGAEFSFPVGIRAIQAGSGVTPGAFQ